MGFGGRFHTTFYITRFGFRSGERVSALRRDAGRRYRTGDLFQRSGGGVERDAALAQQIRAALAPTNSLFPIG